MKEIFLIHMAFEKQQARAPRSTERAANIKHKFIMKQKRLEMETENCSRRTTTK